MTRSTHRRSFLKAVGAGLATLPFYRPLENAFAQSMGETPPLSFIGVYQPHGVCAEYYSMRRGDGEKHFDLRYDHCTLAAFDDPKTYGQSFKKHILVIEGLDLGSNVNGHDSAATILTGSAINEKKPQNISLDQFLARERGLGLSTRLTSLELAVGDPELNSEFCIAYGAGGKPLSKIIDPCATFDTVFRNLLIGDDPAAVAEARRQQRLGKSVLDFLRGDVDRLRQRVAPAERLKLDQHMSALRDMEKQLTAPTRALSRDSIPPRPEFFSKITRESGAAPYFDAITNAQIDMLAQAIACDITRFATLCLADLSFEGNPLGLPKDNHADVAHMYRGSGLNGGGKEKGDPKTWLPLARLNGYLFGKTARLMQRLSELGALDSTLIYLSGSMGDPAQHSPTNAPTVLAGGANGKFRMGRRLRVKDDHCGNKAMCLNGGANDGRVLNNRLLVSIAGAFGVELERFGTQQDGGITHGALDGLI
ncbi:MAG TPA: DUF1552 domain-containing protein [Polyangiales bacterium]|nr:DUF1552 domain-containing protein [Polyangiales bacterium]